MSGRNLRGVIPRRARLRILSLAESIGKSLSEDDISKSITQSMIITQTMGKAVTLAGDDTVYLKKADIKRDWERKQKLALKKSKLPETVIVIDDDIPPKMHSQQLADKIAKIKWYLYKKYILF